MNPSPFNILAIATLIFDEGARTTGRPTARALRMRVNMSAIGSDVVIK
jgi:uncharacterized membrane protein